MTQVHKCLLTNTLTGTVRIVSHVMHGGGYGKSIYPVTATNLTVIMEDVNAHSTATWLTEPTISPPTLLLFPWKYALEFKGDLLISYLGIIEIAARAPTRRVIKKSGTVWLGSQHYVTYRQFVIKARTGGGRQGMLGNRDSKQSLSRWFAQAVIYRPTSTTRSKWITTTAMPLVGCWDNRWRAEHRAV